MLIINYNGYVKCDGCDHGDGGDDNGSYNSDDSGVYNGDAICDDNGDDYGDDNGDDNGDDYGDNNCKKALTRVTKQTLMTAVCPSIV